MNLCTCFLRCVRCIGRLTFLGGILIGGTAPADVLSSDAFSGSPVGSDLLGKSGGSGWGGPWTIGGFNASIHTNYDIAGGSLTFPGLQTSGERVSSAAQSAISGVSRSLATPVSPSQTTTRYLSALLRLDGPLNAGAFNGFFGLYLDGGGINNDDLFIGKAGGGQLGQWVVETRGGSGQVPSGELVVPNQTALLVLKAELRPGPDTFSLLVNPSLPGTEPNVYDAVKTGFDLGQVNGITLYSTGAFSVDEIRWGETYADVTPGPEPATLIMAMTSIVLAGVVASLRRRPMRNRKRR